ncbi:MAG: hypothetical protein AB2660_18575 [Candidatus Thiodiazotropha sp.]
MVAQAYSVCCPQPSQLLFESQLNYWLAIKYFMSEGGYNLVNKRVPGVSEPLAEQIQKATNHQLCAISHSGLCMLKHVDSDEIIFRLLKDPVDKNTQYYRMLQALASKNEHPSDENNH